MVFFSVFPARSVSLPASVQVNSPPNPSSGMYTAGGQSIVEIYFVPSSGGYEKVAPLFGSVKVFQSGLPPGATADLEFQKKTPKPTASNTIIIINMFFDRDIPIL